MTAQATAGKPAPLGRCIEDHARTEDVVVGASPVKTSQASYNSRRSWLILDDEQPNIRATWLVASPVASVSATCRVRLVNDSSHAEKSTRVSGSYGIARRPIWLLTRRGASKVES